jgi:hypothetical protein
VYAHTLIASYQHWGARSAGQLRVGLLALDGRGAELAGGLSSDPILSGLHRTLIINSFRKKVGLFFGPIPKSVRVNGLLT